VYPCLIKVLFSSFKESLKNWKWKLGLGDMAKKIYHDIFLYISVDIDNDHDKCHIFIYFKF